MTTKQTTQDANKNGWVESFKKACLKSCDKVIERIKQARAGILAEAQDDARISQQMLQSALNEAEAIAWQTNVPHLIFPTLAMERVQAVSNWSERQRLVRRQNHVLVLTA